MVQPDWGGDGHDRAQNREEPLWRRSLRRLNVGFGTLPL